MNSSRFVSRTDEVAFCDSCFIWFGVSRNKEVNRYSFFARHYLVRYQMLNFSSFPSRGHLPMIDAKLDISSIKQTGRWKTYIIRWRTTIGLPRPHSITDRAAIPANPGCRSTYADARSCSRTYFNHRADNHLTAYYWQNGRVSQLSDLIFVCWLLSSRILEPCSLGAHPTNPARILAPEFPD